MMKQRMQLEAQRGGRFAKDRTANLHTAAQRNHEEKNEDGGQEPLSRLAFSLAGIVRQLTVYGLAGK